MKLIQLDVCKAKVKMEKQRASGQFHWPVRLENATDFTQYVCSRCEINIILFINWSTPLVIQRIAMPPFFDNQTNLKLHGDLNFSPPMPPFGVSSSYKWHEH